MFQYAFTLLFDVLVSNLSTELISIYADFLLHVMVQIVKRTIEMIISEQPLSSNVLCSDYDKASDFHVMYLYL